MNKKLKKYQALLSMSLKDAFAYRNEMVVWAILESTPVFTTLILWIAIFSSGNQISGFNLSTITTYYILGFIFQQLTASHFEEYAVTQIQEGRYSVYFLRPFSVKLFHTVGQISWRVITLFTSVIPILLLAFIFFNNTFSSIHWNYLPVLVYFLIVGYLIESVISLMIVSMGFVFEQAKSFRHLKWMLGTIFSGAMLPLDFYPPFLKKLSHFLFFKVRFYTPIQIMMGKLSPKLILIESFQALTWLIVLTFFMNYLWKINNKKYTAVGS